MAARAGASPMARKRSTASRITGQASSDGMPQHSPTMMDRWSPLAAMGSPAPAAMDSRKQADDSGSTHTR